jgi:Ni/Fe-hydrogenase subunit HybB-like protein
MDQQIREEILAKRERIPVLGVYIFLVIAIIGFATFAFRVFGSEPDDAWQAFLINFLFWTGIAQAGIVFSCILRITNARWARPLLRVGEALGSFLPISLILLLIIFLGRDYLFPYATEHYHHPKDVWLNMKFVFGRDVIGFIVLLIVSSFYLYYSLRQDLGGAGEKLSGLAGWVSSGWSGEDERQDIWIRIGKFAPAVIILYALVFSFFAWDFMMSLDPYWFSTLFGPYYFMASFLSAISMTIVLSVMLRRRLGLEEYLDDNKYHDIGKLFQGFSLFWVYLFFSQLLPIWYANMPEETGFVIKRVQDEPFKTLSWAVLTCCFIFPFVSLIPRTNKIVKPIVVFIASVSLTGFLLEKYVLVTPSFTNTIDIGLTQILITLGFLGAFIMTFLMFIRTFPSIPVGDPFFGGKDRVHQVGDPYYDEAD